MAKLWCVAGGEAPNYDDISLLDFMRVVAANGFISVNLPCNNDLLDEALGEMLLDGPTTPAGIMGLIYEMAKSLAKMRQRLKEYEDTGLSPEEIHQAICAKQHSENSAVPTRKFTETLIKGLSTEDIEEALQEGIEAADRSIAEVKATVGTFDFQQKFNDNLMAGFKWYLMREITDEMRKRMLASVLGEYHEN